MSQQTFDNLDTLAAVRTVLNANALDALSQGETTDQAIASNLNFASGKGLQFDGGTVLTAYETGTWTPTLETSGTDFDAIGYNVQNGTYQRVGNTVYGQGRIRTSSVTKGSATGTIRIGGLPITPSASYPSYSCTISTSNSWLSSNPIAATISQSAAEILLSTRATFDGALVNIELADVDTGTSKNDIEFSFHYEV